MGPTGATGTLRRAGSEDGAGAEKAGERLRKTGEKKQLETIAKEKGYSLGHFINICIDEKLNRLKITLE